MVQHSHLYVTTGKTKSLTIWTFVNKAMFLLFDTLHRFVVAFLPRSKHFLISWLLSLSALILEPKKRKYVTASSFSPYICHKIVGPDTMILVFRMLFQASFSSFAIKWLLSSSSFFPIRGVSSAYLRSLIFLSAILILPCDSFSLAFLMMFSAYKSNKQGDYRQPWLTWCTPFPILNQSFVPCSVLTVLSWSSFTFLRRQVKWSGTFHSIFMIHPVKGFFIVNEAAVDAFEESPAFSLIQWMLAVWSGSLPFQNPACTSENAPCAYCWSLACRIVIIILLECEMSAFVWLRILWYFPSVWLQWKLTFSRWPIKSPQNATGNIQTLIHNTQ